MSSATVQSTSANSGRLRYMFATGLAAAAVQILFLREYLSVFSGNELVIGIILALWLLATAAGSFAGNRIDFQNRKLLAFLYIVSVILGLCALRAVRLLFQPGAMIQPWYIPLIVILTQSDAAFFGGFTFGRLARRGDGDRLYLMENAGAAAGLLLVSLCILGHTANGIILAVALFLFSIIIFSEDFISFSVPKKPVFEKVRQSFFFFTGLFLLLAGLVVIDPVSVRWKYAHKIDKVLNGYEGEIALSRGEGGNLVFLNNVLYRTDLSLPSIEQAVHLPAAMHTGPLRRALVAGNAGHVEQLRKYDGVSIECLETEPLLANNGCTCGTVETLTPDGPFDLILLGSAMPSNAAAGRFYTLAFFRKMRALAGDAGEFSFTLPLSENFLSSQEKRLKDLLQVTLSRAFRHVMVIPGEGYTFVASDKPLPWPVKPLVKTGYLEAYTLASLTSERLRTANMLDDSLRINTADKPAALLLAQQQWLGLFGLPFVFFLGALAVTFAAAIVVSPRTRAALSVGTSGFAAGAYSVALLLIYQFCHGTLYSRISLLMIALTLGFALGSRVKRFPFSDIVIGVYASFTLIALVTVSFPPLALFMAFHAGMGFLAGAQFVTRTGTSWGGLYAADMAGGVFGMALCSTVLVPYFGVTAVAAGLGLLKLAGALAVHDK